jgi:hypothetical protein
MPEVLLGTKHLSAADLDRDVVQQLRRGTGHYLGSVGGIVDGAVAWAGELAILVGDRATPVLADRRVGHELSALQVYQHAGPRRCVAVGCWLPSKKPCKMAVNNGG